MDIRLNRSFRDNRKRRRLQAELGPAAVLALVDLWLAVAETRPDGSLAGLDDRDLELDANWSGTPGALVEALVRLHFLDGASGRYAIHDWAEHQPYVATRPKRVDCAKRAARARWASKVSAQEAPRASAPHTEGNAPSPAPAPLPDPEPSPFSVRGVRAEDSACAKTTGVALPSPAAVLAYARSPHCAYADFDLEAAQYFVDHYAGKGRAIGDWQAILRNWKVRDGGKWTPPAMRETPGKPRKRNGTDLADLFRN